MRGLLNLALAAAGSLVGIVSAAPLVTVHAGSAEDIIITKQDTVNATSPAPEDASSKVAIPLSRVEAVAVKSSKLPLNLVNNYPGDSINAYVTGLDSNGRLVMLRPGGTFFYPKCDASTGVPQNVTANVAIPLGSRGSTTTVTLPGYISSARVWFARGKLHFFTVCSANGNPSLVEPSAVNPSDPSANVNWGFVELTNTEGGLYANISYVDFVGLVRR